MSYSNSREFTRVRIQAQLEQVIARLIGKPIELLPYDEIRRQLKAESGGPRVLKEIPLDAIVGSVGRTSDFTRHFMPLHNSDEYRWTNVRGKADEPEGLPPIEVYQIGDAYFVADGNHRVSVARHLGATHIEAYVTEVQSRVPLTPDADVNDIAVKARYVDFLRHTELDVLRPGCDLSATSVEAYDALERHIELHRHILSIEQQRGVPYADAVTDWYDTVYAVVVNLIRERNVLQTFPGYTETDVYLWVSGYRTLLEEALNWEFDAEDVQVAEPGGHWPGLLRQVVPQIHEIAMFEASAAPVLPGEWRRRQILGGLAADSLRSFRLFTSILVPVSGQEKGWAALHQALEIAQREHGRVLGVHVVATPAERDTEQARSIRDEFQRRCSEASIPGSLTIDVGSVAATICRRSRWIDLIVARLSYPPPTEFLPSLGSGMRSLLRHCHSPLWLLPTASYAHLERILVAYDGSRRSEEALRAAAYLAQHWGLGLHVLFVTDSRPAEPDVLAAARTNLQKYGVQAAFLTEAGQPSATILAVAEKEHAQLIVMGGYGHPRVLEALGGSVIDEVLRQTTLPVLVC